MSKRERISPELKGPDAFVTFSEHALSFIERHARVIGTLVLIAFLGGLGYVSMNFLNHRKEAAAAEALYQPENDLKKAEAKIREDRAEKMKDLASPGSKDKVATKPESARPVNFQSDYAPAVEKIRAKIKENSGTRAALISSLNLASFLIQQKQYPLALEVLELPTFQPGSGDLLGGFRLMHKGLAYLENGKADEALQSYEQILKAKDLAYFHSEALLKSGVAYELKGDANKARETYEKLGREFPNTEASTTGMQYIRLLDLKAKG